MSVTDRVAFVNNGLEIQDAGTHISIVAWGPDSVRVRVLPEGSAQKSDWALDLPQAPCTCTGEVTPTHAILRNGQLEVRVTATRTQPFLLSFWRRDAQGGATLLLQEKDDVVWANARPARRFRSVDDELYYAEQHFESDPDERLFGMGQNETAHLNLKGSVIDLYQRHVKAPIPFVLSSRLYGFLWNNPSLGRVEFANEGTRWISYGCRQTDYYITTGRTYAEIFQHYTAAVGRAPVLPEWASGFWQCKLRYRTQDEFLHVAREFARRKLPLSVLVIDYYHWDRLGNWRFDPKYWPDPAAMCRELREMGVRVMVSPWTLVAADSINFSEMERRGLFTGSTDGRHDWLEMDGTRCRQYDPTNPEAAAFLWERWKASYVDNGITTFWLDPCDELHPVEEYDRVTFAIGRALECHSAFVTAHQKNIYDGLTACGEQEVVNVCRNAWVGSWRYGACPAPHDIESSFRHLKTYFKVGLNMMVSGTPWWNCDIGGFVTDDNNSDEFYECMIRWYQWGVFMPIFRTHGNRANNEPWTVGGGTYPYIKAQLLLREALRPYLMEQMRKASETGLPPVRPLYFDFQADETAYCVEDELLFGAEILAAPVLEYKQRARTVYLPAGADWIDARTGQILTGGQRVEAPAPLGYIPMFLRKGGAHEAQLLQIFRSNPSDPTQAFADEPSI